MRLWYIKIFDMSVFTPSLFCKVSDSFPTNFWQCQGFVLEFSFKVTYS